MSKKDFIFPVCSIETKKMKEVLNLCSMAVSKSHNDPYILMHIRMSFNFKEKLIHIQSTNIQQGLSTNIPFDFNDDSTEKENFVCCVPHRELSKIVSICYDELFKLIVKEESMLIKYGNSNHSIPIMVKDAKEFPVWKKVLDTAPVILINDKESQFCDFAKKMIAITNNLDLEDATCYIGLECKNNITSLSVTNKFIISVVDFEIKCSEDFDTILITKDGINLIHKLFSNKLVKLFVGNEFIIVKSKEAEVFILLSKIKAFNTTGMYSKLSSEKGDNFYTTKSNLLNSLESVSIVDDICFVEAKKDNIILSTENKELKQKANSKIECDISNFNVSFNFNINYLFKILDIIKGEDIFINLSNNTIKVSDIDNPNIKNLFATINNVQ